MQHIMIKKQFKHEGMADDYEYESEYSSKSHKREKSNSLSDKRRKSRGMRQDRYAY
jgi:hypothetical protein